MSARASSRCLGSGPGEDMGCKSSSCNGDGYGRSVSSVVVDVSVTGDGDGNLEVTWELEGGGAVEIAVGPTPETVDHGHPVAVVADDRRITLHDLGTGRHYVSVAPQGGGSAIVAAERL